MTRHHAHAGNHLVMALAGVIAVTCAAICWAGLARMFGGLA